MSLLTLAVLVRALLVIFEDLLVAIYTRFEHIHARELTETICANVGGVRIGAILYVMH